MIPKQAIIAAREAMREVTPPPGVSKAEWLAEHGDYALIAGAIAAAAPYMQAEVWHEGYDRAETDYYETGFWTKRLRANPYMLNNEGEK